MTDAAASFPWGLEPGWPFTVVLLGALALSLLLRFFLMRAAGKDRYIAVTGFLERGLLFLFLAVLVGLSALQILLRNLAHKGLLWIDPLLRTCVLWLCFLGAAAAT